jgi:putative phosphoesterase
MKVALIGDVHANLPALEAVLAHAREQEASAIWNSGDFVGYGAHPNEVVRKLRDENALSTIGSYDQRVLRFKKRREKWRRKQRLEEYVALEWAYGQLSKRSRKYLRFLSAEMRMTVKGRRVLLTHGCPGPREKSISPKEPEETLVRLGQDAGADLIVCGLSHKPFARQADGIWFINPGSVGLPVDGDPRASYALLQFGAKEIQVTHHRVAYDVEQMATALRDARLPTAFAEMFRQGRDLEAVLGDGK